MTDRRTFIAGMAGVGLGALFGCGPRPPRGAGGTPTTSRSISSAISPRVAGTVATGLSVPWGIAFLPDGRALVGQRDSGAIVAVDPAGSGIARDFGKVPGVFGQPGLEHGLMGLALDPQDAAQLYAFMTTSSDQRIVRIRLRDDAIGDVEPVLTGIPAGTRHCGGRLAFGSDGFLYASTGDTQHGQLAQDRQSLAGKILRITPDGKPAPGNPFGNEVWSWGHRNVEGLAFDGEGLLWATEFGNHTADELNVIRKGRNYGWPDVEGTSGDSQFTNPATTWPPAECSPSGLAITHRHAFIGALRGQRLWVVPLDGASAGEPRDFFVGRYGRLRTVVVAPDGALWVTTSNTDGRRHPNRGDDRILRIAVG